MERPVLLKREAGKWVPSCVLRHHVRPDEAGEGEAVDVVAPTTKPVGWSDEVTAGLAVEVSLREAA